MAGHRLKFGTPSAASRQALDLQTRRMDSELFASCVFNNFNDIRLVEAGFALDEYEAQAMRFLWREACIQQHASRYLESWTLPQHRSWGRQSRRKSIAPCQVWR